MNIHASATQLNIHIAESPHIHKLYGYIISCILFTRVFSYVIFFVEFCLFPNCHFDQIAINKLEMKDILHYIRHPFLTLTLSRGVEHEFFCKF